MSKTTGTRDQTRDIVQRVRQRRGSSAQGTFVSGDAAPGSVRDVDWDPKRQSDTSE